MLPSSTRILPYSLSMRGETSPGLASANRASSSSGLGAFAFGGQGEFAAFAREGFVLDVLPVVGEGFAAVFDGGSSVAGGFGVVYDEVAAARRSLAARALAICASLTGRSAMS